MDVNTRLQRALRGALEQLLRPLCRLLLRHSIPFDALVDIAKRVYVNVAWHEFNVPGKKPTASRVAVLSGAAEVVVCVFADTPLRPGGSSGAAYRQSSLQANGFRGAETAAGFTSGVGTADTASLSSGMFWRYESSAPTLTPPMFFDSVTPMMWMLLP